MFQTKVVEKTKTHILCSITFSRKSCRLWDNVEKYGTVRQATDHNIIRRMRFACWITKATDTHSECVTLTALRTAKNRYANAPQCYVYTYIACPVSTHMSVPPIDNARWMSAYVITRSSPFVDTARELSYSFRAFQFNLQPFSFISSVGVVTRLWHGRLPSNRGSIPWRHKSLSLL
jgi:hypothetical protein